MYSNRDTRHAFFELEAYMCHGGIHMLKSEYFGAGINRGDVIMELLDLTCILIIATWFSPPKLEALAYKRETIAFRPSSRDEWCSSSP